MYRDEDGNWRYVDKTAYDNGEFTKMFFGYASGTQAHQEYSKYLLNKNKIQPKYVQFKQSDDVTIEHDINDNRFTDDYIYHVINVIEGKINNVIQVISKYVNSYGFSNIEVISEKLSALKKNLSYQKQQHDENNYILKNMLINLNNLEKSFLDSHDYTIYGFLENYSHTRDILIDLERKDFNIIKSKYNETNNILKQYGSCTDLSTLMEDLNIMDNVTKSNNVTLYYIVYLCENIKNSVLLDYIIKNNTDVYKMSSDLANNRYSLISDILNILQYNFPTVFDISNTESYFKKNLINHTDPLPKKILNFYAILNSMDHLPHNNFKFIKAFEYKMILRTFECLKNNFDNAVPLKNHETIYVCIDIINCYEAYQKIIKNIFLGNDSDAYIYKHKYMGKVPKKKTLRSYNDSELYILYTQICDDTDNDSIKIIDWINGKHIHKNLRNCRKKIQSSDPPNNKDLSLLYRAFYFLINNINLLAKNVNIKDLHTNVAKIDHPLVRVLMANMATKMTTNTR